jgi:phage terminase small subunit
MPETEHNKEVIVKMPKKPKGKPNKLDPRRALFLELYFKPDSPTFHNGLQSALKAGYSEQYALNMISRELPWIKNVSESVSTQYLVEKAREVMKEAVEGKLDVEGKPFYKYKASEFVSSRADKDFTEKKQMDITSAGLPIQETVLKALEKAYSDTEEE